MAPSSQQRQRVQEPIAIIGLACRLPGGNTTPQKLWEFLARGDVASNKVPKSRFNIDGHYDGSGKPETMRSPGGMFLTEEIDLAEFDASFFDLPTVEAVAMDPNQRQLLEVVYEALESAGLSLESLDGSNMGCFVGNFASDYDILQARDPEDMPQNKITGTCRSIQSNRISHFLNIKGTSMTIDTACSSSLVSLDVACRMIDSQELDSAIVAASNIFLNPEFVRASGSISMAFSETGFCYTFDTDADGYAKAEGVNAVIIKRLSDALRDRDPIRSIILGTTSNSNGRTGSGIFSPSSEAQAAAIRRAYANAGIHDFNDTTYLECHGTGTQAGDVAEVNGAGSVFGPGRDPGKPLIVGSIKSNIGHSESAAALSGVIKTVMTIEKGLIPGTPLFINPNPKIDFIGNRVKASRTALIWPEASKRRASVNSFGFGGSNAHAILEAATEDQNSHHAFSDTSTIMSPSSQLKDGESVTARPYTLLLSANDNISLNASIESLCNHLHAPGVNVSLEDLAYTLSERRSKLMHRAFITTSTTDIKAADFTLAKRKLYEPKIGLVFTGQGAQWPQMGKDLLSLFPWTREILEELDTVLQSVSDPPPWSLVTELTEPRTREHFQQPQFAQPLATALQICLISVLESWGIKPCSVLGHSSGEIAAAYTAGYLDRAGAIKVAYYRGHGTVSRKAEFEENSGMLAVGLGAEAIQPYLEPFSKDAWIGCFNSPNSVTISGRLAALEPLSDVLKKDGHFARLLQVDLAYHSHLVSAMGEECEKLLELDDSFICNGASTSDIVMFSSVTASEQIVATDSKYWRANSISPVRFDQALTAMLSQEQSPDLIIEVGPAGALKGPVMQVLKGLGSLGANVSYFPALSRGQDAGKTLVELAGHLYTSKVVLNMACVNNYSNRARTIVDLPKYSWNHSTKYWHENMASHDWRFKKFIHHDLLGSMIPGSSWHAPTWRKSLRLEDVPWLQDHKMGSDVLLPGTGIIAMAIEAIFQKHCAVAPEKAVSSSKELSYRLRDVQFERAVIVEHRTPTVIRFSLTKVHGSQNWHRFYVRSVTDGVTIDHAQGLVSIHDPIDYIPDPEVLEPLESPFPSSMWYNTQRAIGMEYGPAFQNLTCIEPPRVQNTCRAIVRMQPPPSKWEPQSSYPIHPVVLDSCTQILTPAFYNGDSSEISDVLLASSIKDLIINKAPAKVDRGLVVGSIQHKGQGSISNPKNWQGKVDLYDESNPGSLLMRLEGYKFTILELEKKPDRHTLSRSCWMPDISLLSTQNQLFTIQQMYPSSTKTEILLNLFAHKKPQLKVLELNLTKGNTSCLWYSDSFQSLARGACSQFSLALVDLDTLQELQTKFSSQSQISLHLVSLEKESLGLQGDTTYDLIIIKATDLVTSHTVVEALHHSKQLLNKNSSILFQREKALPGLLLESCCCSELQVKTIESDSPSSDPPESVSNSDIPDMDSRISSADTSIDSEQEKNIIQNSPIEDGEFHSILEFSEAGNDDGQSYILQKNKSVVDTMADSHEDVWNLAIMSLHGVRKSVSSVLLETVNTTGWSVSEHDELQPSLLPEDRTIILILDELYSPVLRTADEKQWTSLKSLLLNSPAPILWVTKGAQLQVTNPDSALVQGLFRVVRRENPSSRLTILDVESSASPKTWAAISQVLAQMRENMACGVTNEYEYAERGGILYVERLIPDTKVNDFKNAETIDEQPVLKGLYSTESQVQLRAGRVGILTSLTWYETDGFDAIDAGNIEVEVKSVGVNFKDVAITMGIVGGDEQRLGAECSGVVRRLGPGTTGFKIGDRVAVMSVGSYANRLQVPTSRAHIIPPWMSFEGAATIPITFMTALHCLFEIANLKQGQSVLIHSAAGGVGLAAIQLAMYRGAEIYTTVGTDEKREYLISLGIPRNRIFSSRDTKFMDQIYTETNGSGIDVILNSLTGDLLDASWRLCADNGTMVEIGKRDMIEHNNLAMEPFGRGCSYRAVDLSFASSEMVERLLTEVFNLVERGHIKLTYPIIKYGFNEVSSALAHIRRGQHIGKLVISTLEKADPELPIVPIRPKLQLDPEAYYLIIGGLSGLCGSLAIHMARNGAQHIIVSNRSGISDQASRRIIRGCSLYGCKVKEEKGDICNEDFVRGIFKNARGSRRIAGVVQGAMLLRDKPYETMTLEDFQQANEAKVNGTWNLHRASVEEQEKPLDFFTMLSSTSGVMGNKGQSNYAAANTFLDAFAKYRQSQHLAATSLDLGVIRDVGYLAAQGDQLEDRYDQSQWTHINENMLRRIFGYSIRQQNPDTAINLESSSQLITGIAYPQNLRTSDLHSDPRFGYFFNPNIKSAGMSGTTETVSENDEVAQKIQSFKQCQASGADSAALTKSCVEVMSVQIIKILRLEMEIDPGKPLISYGIDSLSAVELRGWVQQRLGVEISSLDITNASSLAALCEKMVGKLAVS